MMSGAPGDDLSNPAKENTSYVGGGVSGNHDVQKTPEKASSGVAGSCSNTTSPPPTASPADARPSKHAGAGGGGQSGGPKMVPCDACATPTQFKLGKDIQLCAKDMVKLRQFTDQATRAGKLEQLNALMTSNLSAYLQTFREWLASPLGFT
jgi:hypothetical protein